jgi:hypothetical protein
VVWSGENGPADHAKEALPFVGLPDLRADASQVLIDKAGVARYALRTWHEHPQNELLALVMRSMPRLILNQHGSDLETVEAQGHHEVGTGRDGRAHHQDEYRLLWMVMG